MATSLMASYIHFALPAIIIGISAIANALGQGVAALAGIKAINEQPSAREEISDTLLLGLALIETSGVLCFISCIYIFKGLDFSILTNPYACYAEIGIGLLFVLTAGPVGFIGGLPVKGACESIARQPFFANKIKTLMLITQTLLQAPIIFAFLLMIFIKPLLADVSTGGQALQIMSSGLAFGLGSLGPIIGLGIFTSALCKHAGRNREAYSKLLFFTFASEAVISSSIVFALIIALFILKMTYTPFHEALYGVHFLSAALAIGLSTFGVGIGCGSIAAQGAEEIATNPNNSSEVMRMCLISQAMIETCTLYGLLVAFTILFI